MLNRLYSRIISTQRLSWHGLARMSTDIPDTPKFLGTLGEAEINEEKLLASHGSGSTCDWSYALQPFLKPLWYV